MTGEEVDRIGLQAWALFDAGKGAFNGANIWEAHLIRYCYAARVAAPPVDVTAIVNAAWDFVRPHESLPIPSTTDAAIRHALRLYASPPAAEPVSNATVSAAMKIGAAAALRYGPPAAEPPQNIPTHWPEVAKRLVELARQTSRSHDRSVLTIAAEMLASAAEAKEPK